MKQVINKFFRILAQTILKMWGWKIKGDFPSDLKQSIVIVAPHRKGFQDVLLGWCVKEIKPIPSQRFLAKYEAYNNFWYGWIIRYLGGIAIDRKREFTTAVPKGQYVENIKKLLATGESMTIVITPEGTRTPDVPWKRGFYQLAIHTQLSVIPVLFNYDEKVVEVGSVLMITGQVENDLALVCKWYQTASSLQYIPVIKKEDFM